MTAVIGIALLSYQSLQATAASSKNLTDTVEVLVQLNGLLSTLKDAETGQRGYLLTGNESYLEPYINAKAALSNEFRSLRAILADRPQQIGDQTLDTLGQKLLGYLAEFLQPQVGAVYLGLGLVQAHQGSVSVKTGDGNETALLVQLPRTSPR